MALTEQPTNHQGMTPEMEKRLKDLPDEDVSRFGAMLERFAMHMSSRIEYAESRRNTLATAAAAILAAGIAILPLTKDVTPIVRVALDVLGVGFILVAVVVLAIYARQTNFSYGFIQPDVRFRPWKWFYRDALSDYKAFRAPWHTFQRDKEKKATGAAYDDQWADFFSRYMDLAQPRVDALQNLRQVYLLHVNERYKNLFLSQLRNAFFRGLLVAVAASILALAAAALWLHPSNARPEEERATDRASVAQTIIPLSAHTWSTGVPSETH
jgi:hypothetical protein